jgi:GTPase involved in cell partitioning and DNA repair
VIVADQNEQSLRWTTPHVTAEAGTHGGSQNKNGRNGKNTVLRVPCGVVVRRVLDYDEKWDEKSKAVIKLEPEIDQPFDDTNLDYDSSRAFRSYDVDGKAQHVDGMDQEEPDSTSTGDGSCAIENVDTETEDLDISFTPLGDRKKIDVADLDKHGSYAVVAKGGKVRQSY